MISPAFRYAVQADAPALVALIERAYRGPETAGSWMSEAHLLKGPRTSHHDIATLIATGGGVERGERRVWIDRTQHAQAEIDVSKIGVTLALTHEQRTMVTVDSAGVGEGSRIREVRRQGAHWF